jgi:hypothetical protein
MVIAHMGTTAIATVPTDITAIGDTDTMALDPIADTGRAAHIVDGAEGQYTSCRITAPLLSYFCRQKLAPGPGFPGPVTSWGSAASSAPHIGRLEGLL